MPRKAESIWKPLYAISPVIVRGLMEIEAAKAVVENAILTKTQLNDRDLEQLENYARGGRRPLRFQPQNWSVATGKDELGNYLQLKFELDSGSYATTLLREITKTDIA